jgi:hypothetical protein
VANFATPTELAALLKADVDTTSATQALTFATAIVRAFTGQNIEQRTYTGVILPIVSIDSTWGVRLPQRPVTAVSSVAVNGTTYTLGTDYAWNGWAPYIRLAKTTDSTATFQDEPQATVTYTAGYATVPDEVKAVTLGVAVRMYDNPTGLRTFSIDDHAETFAGGDSEIAGVSLLAPERSILRRYRERVGSVRVG